MSAGQPGNGLANLSMDLFSDYTNSLINTLTDPRKRVFIGYLVITFIFAACWLRWRYRLAPKRLLRHLLAPAVWWSESSRADYKLILINRALMLGITPLLIGKVALATLIFETLYEALGQRPLPGSLLPDWAVPIAFTLFLFLLDDFARFYLHRLMHRWPVLWAFHKVHHSARTMTPFTVLRTHPVEGVLFTLRSIIVQAISIGLFLFLFGDQVDLITVLGVNIAVFLFNVAGSNLRHSHIPLHYWHWLEHLLISPAQHQIHHSTLPRHFDRNFGAVLAIWDWIGGSLHLAEPKTKLRFGISDQAEADEHSLKSLYLTPFREALRSASTSFKARLNKNARLTKT